MFDTIDLYLGAFLILSGFSLSLLNIRRVVKRNKFSSVLLSENILLTCIGVAFIARAAYHYNIENVQMFEMDERAATSHEELKQCTIWSAIVSYGPLVVSFVNSFVSLVIDNYLHYNMLQDMKDKDDENAVRDIEELPAGGRKLEVRKLFMFWKRYFSQIIIGLQWIVPIMISLFMFPMGVNDKILPMNEARGDSCMAMINMSNETCEYESNYTNFALEVSKHLPSLNYLETFDNDEDEMYKNKSTEINSVLKNLYVIINDVRNNSAGNANVTSASVFRRPKSSTKCMKLCYIENNKLLLYMFAIAIFSYFVPITISTIILTKIHMMDTKKPNEKTFATRELLYNVLFWTPVMLDTFLSLILCSYSTNGMKTSLINTVANVYQAVKNFMNTKYFKDNTVTPI